MAIENPYHEGELLVQQRLGVADEGRRSGRAISDTIVRGALKFVNQQPMAILGSLGQELDVWASMLFGQPGLMTALDERTIQFDTTQIVANAADPFWVNIEKQPKVGMLVIELATRRRLRVNGRITRSGAEQLRLDVEESYPNCPKYIQRRHITDTIFDSRTSGTTRQGRTLEDGQRRLIVGADTFFVASAHPAHGVDASHRGGNPGFITVLDERRIRIPDYVGNSMFNTLGNFTVNPHAGLVFLDFERPRTLQLIGRPEILWDLDDPTNETGGTRRYWDLEIDRWLETDLPHQLQWEFLDYSPKNPELETAGPEQTAARGTKATGYVCAMCEGVESEQPGDCPKCGVTLCSP